MQLADMELSVAREKERKQWIRKILEDIGCNVVIWSRVVKELGEDIGDTVGCIVDEQGRLQGCVLPRFVDEQTIAVHSTLIRYAAKQGFPYVASILKENQRDIVWLDVAKKAQISSPPQFHAKQDYVTDVDTITKILYLGVMNLVYDRAIGWLRTIEAVADLLLLRRWLHKNTQLERWETLLPHECEKSLIKAYSDFNIQAAPVFNERDMDEYFDTIVESMRCLPPIYEGYNKCIASLIARYERGAMAFSTPEAVRNVMLRLAQLMSDSNPLFIDPAMGMGYTFFDIVSVVKPLKAVGYEINAYAWKMAKILAIVGGVEEKVQIIYNDALNDSQMEGAFNLVVVDPPIGAKIEISTDESGKPYRLFKVVNRRGGKKIDSTDLFIEKSIRMSTPGGIIIVLVPEGTLFSSTSKAIREIMLEQTIVKAIISLPPQAMKPGSNVKTNILVLQKKLHQGDAAQEVFLGRLEQVGEEDVNELIQNLLQAQKDGHI